MNPIAHIITTGAGVIFVWVILLRAGVSYCRQAVQEGDRIAARNRRWMIVAASALLAGGQFTTWLPAPWDMGCTAIAVVLTFALRHWFAEDIEIHRGRTHEPTAKTPQSGETRP